MHGNRSHLVIGKFNYDAPLVKVCVLADVGHVVDGAHRDRRPDKKVHAVSLGHSCDEVSDYLVQYPEFCSRAALAAKRGSSTSSGRSIARNRRSAMAWVDAERHTHL